MKNQNQRKIFSLKWLGWACAALLAAACVVESSEPFARSQAVIRIGDNSSARSLVPDTAPAFAKYELVFTADGKAAVSRTLESSQDRNALAGGGYSVELEEGAWTVEVSAFIAGSGGTFLKAARGTGSLTINSGNPNPSVSITLSSLPMTMNGESKGVFRWNLNLSGVTGNVTATGTITQMIDGIPDAGTYLEGISGSQELASGYYLVRFLLYKGTKTAGVYRAAHIYPGLTTRAEGEDFTFTDADFAEQKYLAGTVAITGDLGGRAVEWVKVRPYQDLAYTMPLAEAVTAQSGSWVLTVPGYVENVYFYVTMKLTGEPEFGTDGGIETGLSANGKKDIALSALWKNDRYTVSYTLGDGSGTPPANRTAGYNDAITLPGQGDMKAPSGQQFNGWRTGGTDYRPGVQYTVTGNTTFTAQWGPITRYIVTPESGGYSLAHSYFDGDYDYWYIYLGKIEAVPLWYGGIITYQGLGTPTYTYSQSFQSSSAFETTVSTFTSSITQTAGSSSTAWNVSGEAGGSWGPFNAKISSSYEEKENSSWSQTDIVEHTNTYTSYNSWATSTTNTARFTLTPSVDPAGKYRPVVLGTVDVFVGVMKKRATGATYYAYNAFPRNPSKGDLNPTYDYVPDGVNFPSDPEISSHLQFNLAWVSSLPPATTPTDWQSFTAASNQTFTILSNKSTAIITGTGAAVTGMRIQASPRTTDLRIIIKNLNFTAPTGQNAIQIDDALGKTITIEARGTNSITGGRGYDGGGGRVEATGGGAAILCSGGSVIIDTTDGTLTLTGGAGGNGVWNGLSHWGAGAGPGITASKGVVVEGGNTVTIRGGRGGNGNTANGNDIGGRGGDGGNGIHCSSGVVSLKNAVVVGGAGGTGGNGHFYSIRVYTSNMDIWNTLGGDGGNGGHAVAAKNWANNGGVTLTPGAKGAVGSRERGDGYYNWGTSSGIQFKQL